MQKPLPETSETGKEQDDSRGDKVSVEKIEEGKDFVPEGHQGARGSLPPAAGC